MSLLELTMEDGGRQTELLGESQAAKRRWERRRSAVCLALAFVQVTNEHLPAGTTDGARGRGVTDVVHTGRSTASSESERLSVVVGRLSLPPI